MSFFGSFAEAKSLIAQVEVSENTHSNSGSKILAGHSSPGGAAEGHPPAHETMTQKRTKLRTRTDSLTRKYAAS